ncbi:MAG: DUF4468 domain-containing protein, partial [Hymenobacter sp.]
HHQREALPRYAQGRIGAQHEKPGQSAGLFAAYFAGMKTALALLLTLATTATHAQTAPAAQAATYPKDATTGLIDYTDVVQVDGVSQAELFKRGKIWLVSTFKSAKDVIQAEDKDAGIIVGKAYSVINIQSGKFIVPAKLFYTLKLNFKDGKYKYELTDFYFENEPIAAMNYQIIKTPVEKHVLSAPSTSHSGKIIASYRQQFDQAVQELIASLKAGMLKSNDF